MSPLLTDSVKIVEPQCPTPSRLRTASKPTRRFRAHFIERAVQRVCRVWFSSRNPTCHRDPGIRNRDSHPSVVDSSDFAGQRCRRASGNRHGKTAAFALPVLARTDVEIRHPQTLVLTPTRELAIQVAKAFETYGQHMNKSLRVATIYGGQHFSIQIRQLQRGPQIVVGTPGRIMDHLRRQQLSLDGLRTLVLDEADEMLRMGFAEDVEWIMSHAPANRQTLLFSATLPNGVRKVAERYLTDPEQIRVKSKSMTAATVSQRVCCLKYSEKMPVLASLLETEPTDGVIVFVKTRQMSQRVAEELCQRGYRASALNGDMQQNQRERTVGRLKSGQLDVLVATRRGSSRLGRAACFSRHQLRLSS